MTKNMKSTAPVEVRQVHARAEHPPPRIARVRDDRAADHAEVHLGVEQRQVDRDLGRRQRQRILRVQVLVVPDLDVPDLLAPLQVRAAEIGDPVARKSSSRSSASAVGRSIDQH